MGKKNIVSQLTNNLQEQTPFTAFVTPAAKKRLFSEG